MSNDDSKQKAKEAATKGPGLNFDDAGKQIRATSKWLIATFGALGAALIGTTSFRDLAALSDDGRSQASQGLAIALLGVTLAIIFTAGVLAPKLVSISQVASSSTSTSRRELKNLNSTFSFLLRGWDSVEEVTRRKAEIDAAVHAAAQARLALPDARAGDSEEEKKARREANEQLSIAANSRSSVDPVVDDLAEVLAFIRLRRRFNVAVAAVIVGVSLAAFGAIRFSTAETLDQASATTDDLSPAASVGSIPTTARMVVESESFDRFAPLLGEECDLSDVAVSIIQVDGDEQRVLVLPQEDCTSYVLDVRDEDAAFADIDIACLYAEGSTGVGSC